MLLSWKELLFCLRLSPPNTARLMSLSLSSRSVSLYSLEVSLSVAAIIKFMCLNHFKNSNDVIKLCVPCSECMQFCIHTYIHIHAYIYMHRCRTCLSILHLNSITSREAFKIRFKLAASKGVAFFRT